MPDIHALRPVPESTRALHVAQEGRRPETDRDTRLTLVVVVVICNGLLGATRAMSNHWKYMSKHLRMTRMYHDQPWELWELSQTISNTFKVRQPYYHAK